MHVFKDLNMSNATKDMQIAHFWFLTIPSFKWSLIKNYNAQGVIIKGSTLCLQLQPTNY